MSSSPPPFDGSTVWTEQILGYNVNVNDASNASNSPNWHYSQGQSFQISEGQWEYFELDVWNSSFGWEDKTSWLFRRVSGKGGGTVQMFQLVPRLALSKGQKIASGREFQEISKSLSKSLAKPLEDGEWVEIDQNDVVKSFMKEKSFSK